MTKGNVGSLLVFDASKMGANGKASEEAVVGIITERGTCCSEQAYRICTSRPITDYLTKMVVQGKSSLNTKVEEIMTHGANGKLITASPSDTVVEVMEDMVDKSIRHVPVVDVDGTMVGMVSMRDGTGVACAIHKGVLHVLHRSGQRDGQRAPRGGWPAAGIHPGLLLSS